MKPQPALGARDDAPVVEDELAAHRTLQAGASQERLELLVERAVQGGHAVQSCLNTPVTTPRICTCAA